MPVQVRETPIGGNLRDFLDVVDYVYRGDASYVRPLDMMVKEQLSSKNPFFEHGEGTTFTAYRNGWCVGRCTAQIDRLHLDRYKDDVGFFSQARAASMSAAVTSASSMVSRNPKNPTSSL